MMPGQISNLGICHAGLVNNQVSQFSYMLARKVSIQPYLCCILKCVGCIKDVSQVQQEGTLCGGEVKPATESGSSKQY